MNATLRSLTSAEVQRGWVEYACDVHGALAAMARASTSSVDVGDVPVRCPLNHDAPRRRVNRKMHRTDNTRGVAPEA